MSNAIASLSVKVIADTHGFDLSDVRKDMALLNKIVADTTPELEVYARRVKVLGEMWEAEKITAEEYGRAIKSLEAGLSHNVEARNKEAEATRKQTEEKQRHEEAARREAAALAATTERWKRFGESDVDKWKRDMQELWSVRKNMTKPEFRQAWTKLRNKDPRIVDAELVPEANPFRMAAKPLAKIDDSLKRFGMSQLAGKLPIVGELEGAAAAAGPAGLAIAAAMAGAAVEVYALSKAVSWLSDTTLEGIGRLDAIADSATALGIQASDLQRLQIAADLADAPVESLTSALGKMEAILGEPSPEMVGTLEKLRLDAEKLKHMRADQAFAAIATQIGTLPTHAEKLSAITDIFGRGNRELANLIDNFDDVNAAAGAFSLTESQFAEIGEADDALKQLRHTFGEITNIVAVELSPVVVEVSGVLKDLLSSDVTQSGLYTGLAAIKSTLDGIGETARTAADIVKANPTVQKAGFIGGLFTQPFSDLGDKMRESAELDKKFAEQQRKREQADAALVKRDRIAGAGDMLKDASVGFAEQLKAAIEYEKELAKLTEQIQDYGNEEAQARRKAVEAGAKSQEQIDRYVASVMALDKLKEDDRKRQDEERQAERDRVEKERKQTALADSFMTDRQRAIRDLREAQSIGVGGDLMDQLLNRTARGLLPQVRDTGPRTVEKGSQEAFRAMARNNRVNEQVTLLREIRDQLRRDALGQQIVVEEVQI